MTDEHRLKIKLKGQRWIKFKG